MTGEALEALFAEHYNAALLYALSLTKSRHLAEDLVSNAFYKALQGKVREDGSFKSWLLTVVRNGYCSYMRRHRFDTELNEQLSADGETLLENLVRDEEYRALYHALSLLPKAQNEAVTLFYFEELSIREIAGVLKKSESYVKTTLCRARMKLKELLQA